MNAARRLLLAAVLASGCGDDLAGVDAGAEPLVCPGGPPNGPEMVVVRSPDGTAYCIDETEVTQRQYELFLASFPPVVPHPSCAGVNDTLEPHDEGECAGAYLPSARRDHPVSCVDWCDAWSYCAYAGKRLCGAGEWFDACSGMGENDYPYGDTYEVETCNAGPEDPGTTAEPVAVATFPGCVGTEPPFDGIFDMSGNVSEWVDDCDEGAAEDRSCTEAGGGSNSRSTSSCPPRLLVPWDDRWWYKGFRCCAGPFDGA